MTTPDTLASLPKKWRNKATESRREADRIRRTINVSTEAEANCYIRAEIWDSDADELEAALDALVEKWEGMAAKSEALPPINLPNRDEHFALAGIEVAARQVLRNCAAELRGRGASEKP